MRTNQILVRWQGGWRWVGSANSPRIEVCQGHAGDSDEVIRKAQAELVTYRTGQTELTVALASAESGDPVPGEDWKEGDTVEVGDYGDLEVEAITFTLGEDGRVVAVPQFGAILDSSTDRISRSISALGGLTGGTSKTARPVPTVVNPNLRPTQT